MVINDIEAYLESFFRWDHENFNTDTPITFSKNNANSKWIRATLNSGRNDKWYKTFGMVSFLKQPTNNKEALVFFRVNRALFTGRDSIAFKPSPGKFYLENRENWWGVPLSQLNIAVDKNINRYPKEFIQVVKSFNEFENSKDTLSNKLREAYGDMFNKLGSQAKDKLLQYADPQIKQFLNNFDKFSFNDTGENFESPQKYAFRKIKMIMEDNSVPFEYSSFESLTNTFNKEFFLNKGKAFIADYKRIIVNFVAPELGAFYRISRGVKKATRTVKKIKKTTNKIKKL